MCREEMLQQSFTLSMGREPYLLRKQITLRALDKGLYLKQLRAMEVLLLKSKEGLLSIQREKESYLFYNMPTL